jgi:hypothetical protein
MDNINLIEFYGKKFNTDKIITHGYHRFYNKELIEYKNMQNIGILEIGVADFTSLDMWKSFFPYAFVYGIDISIEYKDNRLKVYKSDQSNLNNLEIIKNDINHPIYFINDDGSHIPEHQLISFDYLFSNVLQDGGTYIIEDIEVSYWKYGHLYGYNANYGFGHSLSIVEKFKLLIDYVNSSFLSENDKKILDKKTEFLSSKTKDAILSINFSENCIIIKKKQANDIYHQPYVFEKFIKDK